MDNINETTLPGGTIVVSEHVPFVQSFSLGFWYNTGSCDETLETSGVSHFLEHMLFKGTKRRNAKKISDDIESLGGYINAFTAKEHTCYYARGMASNLGKTFDVIADMVQFPLMREKDIKNEIGVILDELNDLNDNPDELIFDKFEELIFPDLPLGYSILGSEQTISSFSREMVTDHHVHHYTPGNLLISASGNITHEQLVKLAQKHLNKSAFRAEIKRDYSGDHPGVEHTMFRETEQVYSILGARSVGYNSGQRLPLNILSLILGEGTSSRLYQNIREKLGITYQINSFINFYKDASSFGIYFSTNTGNFDKAIKNIEKELNKFREREIDQRELKRAKEYLKGSILLTLESTSNRMIRMANLLLNHGRIIPVEEVIQKIDAVTAEEIKDLADELLRFENFTKVFIKPQTKLITTAA
ncbi:pitrilysin family protein [Ignavibacteriales bacterium]